MVDRAFALETCEADSVISLFEPKILEMVISQCSCLRLGVSDSWRCKSFKGARIKQYFSELALMLNGHFGCIYDGVVGLLLYGGLSTRAKVFSVITVMYLNKNVAIIGNVRAQILKLCVKFNA